MAIFRIIFHLCVISSCSFTLVTAVRMKIFPPDAIVQVGQWANITCRVPCSLELNGSHTFNWLVGDHRFRTVGDNFEQNTGIKVEREMVKVCKDRTGDAWHRVRVFASSAERINRTPVQCAALRKSGAFISDYYSYFAVILVKDEQPATTAPATTAPPTEPINSNQLEDISPTHCKPAETVTVYVTPTPLPLSLEDYQ